MKIAAWPGRQELKLFKSVMTSPPSSRCEYYYVIVLYLLMAIFALGANPFKGETSAPTKLLAGYSGWSAHDFKAGDVHPERSDILDHFIPQWTILKKQIRSDDFPLWNSVSVAGRPGILELSRGTLTPSFFAFALVENDALGFYLATLVKIFIAALGTYMLLRLFVTPQAAFIGGLIYSLSGFNAAWLYWPQVSTACWIPWLLWATAGWSIYKKPSWLVLVTLTTFMLILGGFPAVAAYGLYAAVLLCLMLGFIRHVSIVDITKYFGGYLSAIVVAFMIAAIPLLALFELLSMIDMSYRTGGTSLSFPSDLALLFNPFLDGIPRVERTFYVGILPLVLGFTASILFLSKAAETEINRTQKILFLYATALLMISFSISFALLPTKLITLIPAIGGSPWSRVVVLIGLSLALMAAIGLQWLQSLISGFEPVKKSTWVLPILFSFVIAAQYADQLRVFRNFNTVSDEKDFFPDTPALSFVKNNLGYNQGVIADNNFLISGTLGAYGIREWFAHDFRTEVEKQMLTALVAEPFVTPTASVISSANINHGADLMARFGVKFIVQAEEQLVHKQSHKNNKPWPVMLDHPLTQTFTIHEQVSLSAVGLVLATYGAQYSPSDVYLVLRDAKGAELSRAHISAKEITDNKNALFKLDQPVTLNAGIHTFEVGTMGVLRDGKLTAWYSETPDSPTDKMATDGREVTGATLYSLYTTTKNKYGSQWKVHEFANDSMLVLENKLLEEGIYFVPENSSSIDWGNQNLKIKAFSPDVVVIENKMESRGHVVLPMRKYPGWSAYVDGKKVEVETFMEILPAIPVKKTTSEIIYQYNSHYLKTGGFIMALGLMLPLIFLYVYQRKRLIN